MHDALIFPCEYHGAQSTFRFFVIQKLKDAWQKRWDELKFGSIRSNAWTAGGRLPNAEKPYILKLGDAFVCDLNEQQDKNGLKYPRKAMIICGPLLITNRLWEELQHKPELKNIIKTFRNEFENSDGGDGIQH